MNIILIVIGVIMLLCNIFFVAVINRNNRNFGIPFKKRLFENIIVFFFGSFIAIGLKIAKVI